MGMGKPLANYQNVLKAIRRMNTDLGIGARKITVSTVGVVPSIRKLATKDKDLQVRLAVSLHNANNDERSELLPANKRYGGLDELMTCVREYIDTTKRRVTFEWALIEHQNDTPDIARSLGRLLQRHGIRKDMAHVNLIPLNPTGGYNNACPSTRKRVNQFIHVFLEQEFGISATPRVRRGIDIDAGCGQLKAQVIDRRSSSRKSTKIQPLSELESKSEPQQHPSHDNNDNDDTIRNLYKQRLAKHNSLPHGSIVDFALDAHALDLDDPDADDLEDMVYDSDIDQEEVDRLLNLVQTSFLDNDRGDISTSTSTNSNTTPTTKQDDPDHNTNTMNSILVGPTTSITDEQSIYKSKRKLKKIRKNLKAIERLRDLEKGGTKLNQEQIDKISKERVWLEEMESIEHNLQ
eukprot:CAMPEP_0184861382 /NCGR_PEP_ID=MMETSP0580-20130426/6082_1 /TAXON_ID=1118495 /ORGANISM="Dactyliosolen fragilissimus" /LENGTH=405 /DNA_ID=CAMNT_0027358859 /DNA_START=27 /DNA_END=1244 /DNA_ORIENTATION=-